MAIFEISEDSGASKQINAVDWEDARDQAKDWAADGSYDTRVMVTVSTELLDAEDDEDLADQVGDSYTDEVEAGPEPESPDCEGGQEHDWQSPYEVVGGIESNPGVWSLGGTAMMFREVCAHCGAYRVARNTGSQRNPGELEEEVSYEDADERSLAWVEERA